MNKDFLNIVREIRGSGVPGEAYTDGIWYELTTELKNGNPGIYGDILVKYGIVLSQTEDLDAVLTEAQNLKNQSFASQQAAALSESNASDSASDSADSALEASQSAAASESARAAAVVAQTAAQQSASVANASKTDAVNAANSAASSASSAAVDKQHAASSAALASTKADEASASADSVLTSETNASNSADAAAASETNASNKADEAQLRVWEAEAERLTSDSYATELEDTPVNIVTSNGDGTFTYTPTLPAEYSAFHWRTKAQSLVSGGLANFSRYGVVTGLEITINNVDDTTYDIAPGEYYIGDVLYSYPGSTGNTTGLPSGELLLVVGLDANLDIVAKVGTTFTDAELLTIVEIGALATQGGSSSIIAANESVFTATNVLARLNVRIKNYEETVFDSTAAMVAESTTPLQLDLQGGFLNDAEMGSKEVLAATSVGGISLVHDNLGNWSSQTVATHVINTSQYDDGTGLVAGTVGRFLAIDVGRSSRTGTVYVGKPQGEYITFSQALNSEFINNPIFSAKGLDVVPIARIVVKVGDTAIRFIQDYRHIIPKLRRPDLSTQGTNNLSSFGNGAIVETVTTSVDSDGVDVVFNYSDANNSHLTCQFDEQNFLIANGSIGLTAGSDVSPTTNFVYVELVNGVAQMSVNTSQFPSTVHCPVAEVLVPSAATTQVEGPYAYQAWINHMSDETGFGHLHDINYWIRQQGATFVAGSGMQTTTAPAVGGGTVVNGVNVNITAGRVLQLHEYTSSAIDISVDGARIINHPTTPFLKVNDLDVLVDAAGVAMDNTRYNLIVMIAVNEDSTKAYINLPNGTYDTDSGAINDTNNLSDYTIPAELRGKAVLAARITIRHRTISAGSYEVLNVANVAGLTFGGGGSSSIKNEYFDNEFKIIDETDPTKEVQFEVSGVSTGTGRTMTIPNEDGTIALGTIAEFEAALN